MNFRTWVSSHNHYNRAPAQHEKSFFVQPGKSFFFNQFSSSNNYYLSLAVRFWVAKYVNIERVWIKNGINFICLFRFLNKIRTKFLKIGFCCFIAAAAVSFVFKAKNRIRSRGQAARAACFFCIVRNSYPLSLSLSLTHRSFTITCLHLLILLRPLEAQTPLSLFPHTT